MFNQNDIEYPVSCHSLMLRGFCYRQYQYKPFYDISTRPHLLEQLIT